MPTNVRTSVFLALALVTTAAACNKKKPAVTPPAPVPTAPAADNSERDRLERERLERERLERERLERERLERERIGAMRATMTSAIYFGFDRSDLTTEARTSLDAKLAIMNANPAMRIMIEGHTDELGSDEYNLALGQRRAAAAKRYLVQREVDSDRIEIASFGEERPACTDGTEECRTRNRRDEFRIVAGEPVASQR